MRGLSVAVGTPRRAVRRFLQRRLGSTGKPGPRVGLLQRPSVPPSSARRLSFLFLRRAEDRTTEEQALIDRLHAGEVALREGLALAGTFAALVRKEVSQPLADWLVAVSQSSCTELHAFAQGVQRDLEAIQAALTEPWSNGPVEGQVNRLKLVKRQMYGRAGWQLLRARLTQAA